MAIRLAINGAGGRMGQRLVALASTDPQLQVVSALEHAGYPRLGEDAGTIAGIAPLNVPLTQALADGVDVVIDFSVPTATSHILNTCLKASLPLVVATTGLESELQERIRLSSNTIPILWSPSMSLAVNLAMQLTAIAGRALKDDPGGADVEIIERHHRYKVDAPSGTALKFGEILAQAMGLTEHRHGRSGRPGQRPHNEIGYHALRVGDNPGEHTIIFGLLGETLELSVRASNRDCYAHGALAAAKFLAGKPPGLYTMKDVLGF